MQDCVWFVLFFTVAPIYLTTWTGSTPARRQMTMCLFPFLTNCKILAGRSVPKILTNSIMHTFKTVKYNRISAEVSSHKKDHESVKGSITVTLQKGIKNRHSKQWCNFGIRSQHTHSLFNGTWDCAIRTRTTCPRARHRSQATHSNRSHQNNRQGSRNGRCPILKHLQKFQIKVPHTALWLFWVSDATTLCPLAPFSRGEGTFIGHSGHGPCAGRCCSRSGPAALAEGRRTRPGPRRGEDNAALLGPCGRHAEGARAYARPPATARQPRRRLQIGFARNHCPWRHRPTPKRPSARSSLPCRNPSRSGGAACAQWGGNATSRAAAAQWRKPRSRAAPRKA